MKQYLEKLPKAILDLIRLASDTANRNNLPAYLVGGFVRDLILGVKNFDLDIVIEGDGIRFAETFAHQLKARIVRHRRFGTAAIILSNELKIDIASARKEFYPQPAHLPVVTPSSLKDDHFRRDFSVNAMAISINKEDFGSLIDFFGGKEDLKRKKIRILHGLSFLDDPTRILRAIRFEQRYDFKIEAATLKLLKKAVRLKMLEKVEPQRIRDELILMLKEERPLKEIRRMKDLTGFKFINGGISPSKKALALLSRLEKEISWFKTTNASRRPLDAWLMYFMGLADPLSANGMRSVCRKLALKKGDEKRALSFKKIKPGFIRGLCEKDALPSGIFGLLEPLSYEAILMVRAKYNDRDLRRHISDFLEIYNDLRIFISGHDLHNMGLQPGPYYQKIFSKVKAAKLNGLVRTKEEEIVLIKKLAKIE